MATIPLPALHAGVQQPSLFQQYSEAQSILGQRQEQQIRDVQLHQAQLAEQDSETMRNLAPQFVTKDDQGKISGFDVNGFGNAALAAKVNPATISKMKLDYATTAKQLADAGKAQIDLENDKNDKAYQILEGVRGIKDPAQRQAAYQAATPKIQALGVDTAGLPQTADDQALQGFEAHLGVHKQVLNDAKTIADTQKQAADAALANIKVNLSKNSKPGDFDRQIDAIAPPAGPNANLNTRTKANVNAALQRGDFESANKYIEAASSEIGAIEKETNPAVIAAKTQQAVGTEVAKQKALAVPLEQLTQTTMAGRKYINREDLPKEAAGVMEQDAAAKGVRVVDKDTAGTLSDIDDAKANMNTMLDLVKGKLATSPGERIYKGPENKLEAAMQTDKTLASMGTFRNAAIKTMRAVAGSKGLRINQYEVQLAIDNDIPKMTDTWEVASEKIKTLQKFLDNAEQTHLTLNRAQGGGAASGGTGGVLSPADWIAQQKKGKNP